MRFGEGPSPETRGAMRTLVHNYHDGAVLACELGSGPPYDLVLEIHLDTVWNPQAKAQPTVRLRFGGIQNFDAVSASFMALGQHEARTGGAIATIESLSNPSKGRWVIQLDRGDPIDILTSKSPKEGQI